MAFSLSRSLSLVREPSESLSLVRAEGPSIWS